ncbi:MAG: iron ABC transporter permease [Spirochaetaceae bacterium]|nr:MAG: iron ABC transporter permease [Spirochaetaceae bacterium]
MPQIPVESQDTNIERPRLVKASVPRILREPIVPLTIAGIVVVVAMLIILPAATMLVESVRAPEGGLTIERYTRFFGTSYFRDTLFNTLTVSGLATAISLLLGVCFAYTINRTDVPLRGFFTVIVLVPMLLPAFLIAFALILLFGRNGVANVWLRSLFELVGFAEPLFQFNVYGPWGVILAQTLSFFPIGFLMFLAALSAADSRLEDAAADLGASYWYTLRRVTLPLLAPAAVAASLMLFMFHASAFGAPAILGGRGLFFGNANMLAPEAIIQTLGARSDWGMGATLAVILVVPSLFMYLLGEYVLRNKSYVTVSGTPTAFQPRAIPTAVKWGLFVVCFAFSLLIISVVLVVLAGSITQTWGVSYALTQRHFITALTASRRSISNSVQLAFTGALSAALFGMLAAYIYTRKPFPGVRVLDFISMIPYALPGMVMGLGFALAFSGRIPALFMAGTSSIIVLNHFVRRMPYGIRSGVGALKQIDPSIEEAAADLGANPAYSFVRVTLPLLRASFLAAFVFAFMNMMTDITAVIFLVSPRWRLLSVDIFNAIDAARYGTAAALSVIMISVTLAVLGVTWIASGRKLGVLRK